MLDERTILIMMAALQGLMALVASGLRVGHPEDVRGIGSWAWSVAMFSLASLIVSFSPTSPFGPQLLLSNAFFTVAIALIGFSMQRFFAVEPRLRNWLLGGALVYGIAAALTWQAEHANARIALFSLQILVSVVAAAAALRHSGEMQRGFGGRVVAVALLMLGSASLMRLVAAVTGMAPVILMSGGSPVMPLFLVLMNTGLVLGTLGLILIATERMRRRLESLACQDSMTGLLTRGGFAGLAEQALANARREAQSVGLLIVDIDHFKLVNDSHGHQAGDAVICALARALKASARQVDLVARFGGEEFVLLLPQADLAHAAQAAERLRQSIAEMPIRHGDTALQVAICVGVAALPASEASIERLYREADVALYRAKNSGRNRVEAMSDA